MSAVFAHDHIFLKNQKEYYTTGGLTKETLNQYKEVFGSLTILAREQEIQNTSGYALASDQGLTFIGVENFKGVKNVFKTRKAKKLIYNNVRQADFLIARLPSMIGQISIQAAKLYNVPYLIELVGCPFDSYWHHSFIGKLLAPIQYIKTKNIIKKSKYTIYVTKEYLQKKYPTNGNSTNCSNVVLEKFDDKVIKKRNNKISSTSDITFGTIGSLDVKYKGQDLILPTLNKLLTETSINYKYELVGKNNSRRLNKLTHKLGLSNNVLFRGILDRNQIFEWLDSIDIYIQPSLTEGLPRAVIEAMSRGVLVVGSSAGGIPELINEKYIINEIRNHKELFKLLVDLNDEDFYEQAKSNFSKSQQYKSSIIKNRRKAFLLKFKTGENTNEDK